MTKEAYFLPALFIVFGIGLAMFLIYLNWGLNLIAGLLYIPFCALFVISGFNLLKGSTETAIFDKDLGYFWQGKAELTSAKLEQLSEKVALIDIQALQILSELVKGIERTETDTSGRSQKVQRSYHSYELNLVLKDKSRVNVVDHGDLENLRQDAKTLAKFLGVSIWDRA